MDYFLKFPFFHYFRGMHWLAGGKDGLSFRILDKEHGGSLEHSLCTLS